MPKSGQAWNPAFLEGHPLFRPFERIAKPLRTEEFPTPSAFSKVCEAERVRRTPELGSLEFVPKAKKSRRQKRQEIRLEGLYDGSIVLRGEVFCYERSYHDLLNAVVFATFPRSKRALHRRQFEALRRWVDLDSKTIPGSRTREQDSLTIFDEGGVILAMREDAHREWLRTKDKTLYSPGEGGVCALLFGHALLEHLLEGHLAIRASAVVCVVESAFDSDELLDEVDRLVSARLLDEREFVAPGADSIFEMNRDGSFHFGAPKPGFSLWNLGSPASDSDPVGV